MRVDPSQQLARLLGVPLGAKRESLQPVIGALAEHGVAFHDTTVSRLRIGDTTGVKLLARLRCAALLQTNSAEQKDRFYLMVAEAGLHARQVPRSRRHPRKYTSDGCTEQVAAELKQPPQPIRRCLRAMRADLLASIGSDASDELSGSFRHTAEAYLAACLDGPPSTRPPLASRIDTQWDHRSILGFYRVLYAGPQGGRALGTWTPYEVEICSVFYRTQAAGGHRLTPLDRLVLEAYLDHRPLASLAAVCNETAAVAMDVPVPENHRNALVYGRPTPQEDATTG